MLLNKRDFCFVGSPKYSFDNKYKEYTNLIPQKIWVLFQHAKYLQFLMKKFGTVRDFNLTNILKILKYFSSCKVSYSHQSSQRDYSEFLEWKVWPKASIGWQPVSNIKHKANTPQSYTAVQQVEVVHVKANFLKRSLQKKTAKFMTIC